MNQLNIEEIVAEWAKDCKLDDTELDSEALNVPYLHAKYLKHLADTRIRMRASAIKKKELWITLSDYYRGDLNNVEDLERVKREPWPKTVLKNDLPQYVEADADMMKLNSRIAVLEETVGVLEEILKAINNRGFAIKNAIDWRKLTNFAE